MVLIKPIRRASHASAQMRKRIQHMHSEEKYRELAFGKAKTSKETSMRPALRKKAAAKASIANSAESRLMVDLFPERRQSALQRQAGFANFQPAAIRADRTARSAR